MAKYLITGVAGFIGSNIAHTLIACGDQVRESTIFLTDALPTLPALLTALISARPISPMTRLSDLPATAWTSFCIRLRAAQCRVRWPIPWAAIMPM